MKYLLRDWRKLGECQKVIQHSPEGGEYGGLAVNSNGLLAVTDDGSKCVHLISKDGALVRSIGEGEFDEVMSDVAFDLKGNVWVTDYKKSKVVKLSQDGHVLHTICHAGSEGDRLQHPFGVSVSPEGLVYVCDDDNHRVTVFDEEGKCLFDFGSKGSGPECFGQPRDVAFGSDGLVYVTDAGNNRVSMWSKQGTFMRCFSTEDCPYFAAATADGHLLITSYRRDTVLVYTLGGELVHRFGERGREQGKFRHPQGICVDGSGKVYVADSNNTRIQVFW